jgi:hypothetical protein
MITTPTVSGKPGQAPMRLSCDLYPLICVLDSVRDAGRDSDGAPTRATRNW